MLRLLRLIYGRVLHMLGREPPRIVRSETVAASADVSLSDEAQRMVFDGMARDTPTPIEVPLRGSVRDRIARGRR